MADVQPAPAADEEPTFAQAWEALAPGERANKGAYSVYKTMEGSLLISYRPDSLPADADDLHMEVPAAAMGMLAALSEGNLSMIEMAQMVMRLRRMAGGMA